MAGGEDGAVQAFTALLAATAKSVEGAWPNPRGRSVVAELLRLAAAGSGREILNAEQAQRIRLLRGDLVQAEAMLTGLGDPTGAEQVRAVSAELNRWVARAELGGAVRRRS